MSPTSPRTSKASSRSRTLHLFRRDLRLDDHAGLVEASRLGDVVPALVCDASGDRSLARSPRRAAYYAGAVSALAAALRARGTELVCRRGSLVPTVLALAREAGVANVTWTARYDAAAMVADRDLSDELARAGFGTAIVHDAPAVAPGVTAALRADADGRGYRAFAPYALAWRAAPRAVAEARVAFAAHGLTGDPLPQPSAAALGEAASDRVAEDAALERESADPARALAAYDRFLAGPVLAYPSAVAIPAGAPTARVSAALSFGVLSARTLLARLDARMRDPFLLAEEKVALAAFARTLARRDFFLQLAWYYDESPDAALQTRMRDFPFARDHAALEAWRCGETGYPLVDAGIRQMRATGWMHPRVRLVAASFCCFDLGVDWRIGRDAWDAHLVEDDGALASGNWQWVAGVGADLAQVPRIYNPRKQLRAIDPRGNYVRRYVRELAHASDADLFGGSRTLPQLALELYADARYPAPVVEHDRVARAFLARYADFTRVATP